MDKPVENKWVVCGEFAALHPDDFLIAQLDLDEFAALAAFRDMRARKKSPALNAEEFAHALERNGLVATANRLRLAAALI